MSEPSLIAVDWGTSRLRAFLLSADGSVQDRMASDDGIMAVPSGGFQAVLERAVAPWLARWPTLDVAMAGMVGSRNGWVEAPYVECPAALDTIAAATIAVPLGGGGQALIVPGLVTRDSEGVPDVMRGEETKIAGSGVMDGVIVMPGTHSKWAWLSGGRIEGFATFMTGDFFGALGRHTIVSKLVEEPPDQTGFGRGLAAATRHGGLTHLAFAARTQVLLGDMPGTQVRPFLSGLLIGTEIAHGLALTKPRGPLTLVADGAFAEGYSQALAAVGQDVKLIDPEVAFIAGLRRLATPNRSSP